MESALLLFLLITSVLITVTYALTMMYSLTCAVVVVCIVCDVGHRGNQSEACNEGSDDC